MPRRKALSFHPASTVMHMGHLQGLAAYPSLLREAIVAGDESSLATALTDPLHTSGDNYAWEYGATGALSGLTDPTLNRTSYSYDALGRLMLAARSNNRAVEFPSRSGLVAPSEESHVQTH